MKKINLRELYPDVYTTDFFVDVTEEVMETIRAAERAEAAYERKMYRYKAQYSLDCENGIENAVLLKPQTPEMVLEEKQFQEQVYAAVMKLPEKQAKRIYARYYLGMTVNEIAEVEGVDPSRVRDSIRRGLKQLGKYFWQSQQKRQQLIRKSSGKRQVFRFLFKIRYHPRIQRWSNNGLFLCYVQNMRQVSRSISQNARTEQNQLREAQLTVNLEAEDREPVRILDMV